MTIFLGKRISKSAGNLWPRGHHGLKECGAAAGARVAAEKHRSRSGVCGVLHWIIFFFLFGLFSACQTSTSF